MKRPQRSPEKPLTGKGFWPADGKGFRPVDGRPQGRNGWIETLLYLDGWQTHRCLFKINIHFQCLLSYPLCQGQTFFFFSALYTTTITNSIITCQVIRSKLEFCCAHMRAGGPRRVIWPPMPQFPYMVRRNTDSSLIWEVAGIGKDDISPLESCPVHGAV